MTCRGGTTRAISSGGGAEGNEGTTARCPGPAPAGASRRLLSE